MWSGKRLPENKVWSSCKTFKNKEKSLRSLMLVVIRTVKGSYGGVKEEKTIKTYKKL